MSDGWPIPSGLVGSRALTVTALAERNIERKLAEHFKIGRLLVGAFRGRHVT